MNHLSLENFHSLLTKEATQKERAVWADHILECDTCAARFRLLAEFDAQIHQVEMPSRPKKAIPLKYILGVAAVMIMCVTPYLSSPPKNTSPVFDLTKHERPINILRRVHEVNYQTALEQWNQEADLIELIQLTNKPR